MRAEEDAYNLPDPQQAIYGLPEAKKLVTSSFQLKTGSDYFCHQEGLRKPSEGQVGHMLVNINGMSKHTNNCLILFCLLSLQSFLALALAGFGFPDHRMWISDLQWPGFWAPS